MCSSDLAGHGQEDLVLASGAGGAGALALGVAVAVAALAAPTAASVEFDREDCMKAVLVGHGRMGRLLEKMIEEREGMEVAGIVDIGYHERISDIKNEFDVIIDYSHPDNLDKIYEYEINEAKPLVIATTGYTSEQISQIEEIAKTAPVVYTANFSCVRSWRPWLTCRPSGADIRHGNGV